MSLFLSMFAVGTQRFRLERGTFHHLPLPGTLSIGRGNYQRSQPPTRSDLNAALDQLAGEGAAPGTSDAGTAKLIWSSPAHPGATRTPPIFTSGCNCAHSRPAAPVPRITGWAASRAGNRN